MSEAIALKPRNHVQVHVKDLLPGGLAICQEQVDTLGFQIRLSDGRRKFLCRFEECTADTWVKVSEVRGVPHRNDEQVPRIDWTDVHHGDAGVISVDHAGRRPTGDDVTEDACFHGLVSGGRLQPCGHGRGLIDGRVHQHGEQEAAVGVRIEPRDRDGQRGHHHQVHRE